MVTGKPEWQHGNPTQNPKQYLGNQSVGTMVQCGTVQTVQVGGWGSAEVPARYRETATASDWIWAYALVPSSSPDTRAPGTPKFPHLGMGGASQRGAR